MKVRYRFRNTIDREVTLELPDGTPDIDWDTHFDKTVQDMNAGDFLDSTTEIMEMDEVDD